MKRPAVFSSLPFLLALISMCKDVAAQAPPFCYASTSTFIWTSGNYVYSQGFTNSQYCSGTHDVWAKIRLTSPTGRFVEQTVGMTRTNVSAWASLAMLAETGTFTATTEHREYCYIALTTFFLGSTSAASPVPCAVPTGETINSNGWSDPNQPAIHLWAQTLQPGTASFSGRTVKEFDAPGGEDTCWYQGNPQNIPPQTTLSGGQWIVTPGNTWGPDGVGWEVQPFNAVTYYRGLGRAPCSSVTPQIMGILCTANSTWYQYVQHTQIATIGSVTVSSAKDNNSASRSY